MRDDAVTSLKLTPGAANADGFGMEAVGGTGFCGYKKQVKRSISEIQFRVPGFRFRVDEARVESFKRNAAKTQGRKEVLALLGL